MAESSRFFFVDRVDVDAQAAAKHLTAEGLRRLGQVRERLAALTDWRAPAIHAAVNDLATQLAVGLGKIAQPVRVAVAASACRPPST